MPQCLIYSCAAQMGSLFCSDCYLLRNSTILLLTYDLSFFLFFLKSRFIPR